MVTIHKVRRKSMRTGGSNNYVFLINASDEYTASIYDNIKEAIYRNAIEDYFRYIRAIHTRKLYHTYYYRELDEIRKIDKFMLSGAYNFDLRVAKILIDEMHKKCEKEYPEVFRFLYGG